MGGGRRGKETIKSQKARRASQRWGLYPSSGWLLILRVGRKEKGSSNQKEQQGQSGAREGNRTFFCIEV